jgi:hypothetical protein
MLTVEEATGICGVVASDPESSKRIDSDLDSLVPASWGIAGGLRNAGYVALGMVTFGRYGDPTEPEFANRVCTGISDAASLALNRAAARGDARLRNLQGATPVSRILKGVDHTAVQIEMKDGQKHVLDWHATLDAQNPLMFRTPGQWVKGEGGVPRRDFRGWK